MEKGVLYQTNKRIIWTFLTDHLLNSAFDGSMYHSIWSVFLGLQRQTIWSNSKTFLPQRMEWRLRDDVRIPASNWFHSLNTEYKKRQIWDALGLLSWKVNGWEMFLVDHPGGIIERNSRISFTILPGEIYTATGINGRFSVSTILSWNSWRDKYLGCVTRNWHKAPGKNV